MIDKITLKFAIIGVINTLVGTAIMFILYNFVGLGYWISSSLNYIVGSILSFILNKNFTFNNKNTDLKQIIRYVINIAFCYFVAYALAKPFVYFALENLNEKLLDNLAMLTGMVFYTVLNYIGQRYFVFKANKNSN